MSLLRRGLPARIRLTLWYGLLLICTLLVLGGAALWLVQRALYANADDVLRSKAAAVQTELDFEGSRLNFDPDKLAGGRTPAVVAGLDVARVWNRRSRWVYQFEGLDGIPQTDPGLLQEILVTEQPSFTTVWSANGVAVRLYSEPVRLEDSKWNVVGVIQVGRSLTELESIMNQLKLIGTSGLLVALVLAWLGGYFVAGRALAPVDRITRAAERIGAENLSGRLDLRLPNDELGRLAHAFDGMIERLDEAFQRQRRFTADAAHELRTPLAINCAEAEAARQRPREPRADGRVLDDIYIEGQRLRQLVESLLTLARIDAGQPLTLVPLDLEDLVAGVTERIAPRAHERGLQIVTLIGEPAAVLGDANWLTQLLLNLLDNAIAHTPPGGQVTLTMERAPDGVVLKVADTGEGIPPEHLPHVFERFYRADLARTRVTGGAGLGLAICVWVAQVHNGRLEVESEVGRGTVFSLWLPAAPSAQPRRRRPQLSLQAGRVRASQPT